MHVKVTLQQKKFSFYFREEVQLFEFKGHSYQQFKLSAKMMFSWSACTFCGLSIAALAEPNFWRKKINAEHTPNCDITHNCISKTAQIRKKKKNGESGAGPSDFQ